MLTKFQGLHAWKLFHGVSSNSTTKLLYSESASLFAKILRSNLSVGSYTLLDMGSHRGELLEDLVSELNGYDLNTIAVDLNEEDLATNGAQTKIKSDLAHLPIENKSVDIDVARYVMAWNSIAKQKEIIKEIARVTKRIAIIQHQGADQNNPKALQNASKKLFDGSILSLEREEFYFSSSDEIETIFKDLDLNFEKIQSRRIDNLSDVYIEKYQIPQSDATKVKEILSGSDYIIQTTWVIKF